jgi:hypothetical protein
MNNCMFEKENSFYKNKFYAFREHPAVSSSVGYIEKNYMIPQL